MPRIPTYQRQGTVTSQGPSVTGNVNINAPVTNALAGAGSELGQLSDTIFKRQAEIKKEEQYYSTQRIGNLVNDEALTFQKESLERQGVDAFNSMEWADEWKKATLEKYTKDISDERMKFNIAQHIESQAHSIKNTLANHEARQRDLVAEDTRINTLASAAKSAYQGFGTLDDNMKIYNNAIINDPRLRDTERENKLIAGQSAIADSYLDGVVNRNPSAAVEMIKSGLFNKYLDKSKIERFDKKAHEILDADERDKKTAEIEAKRLQKEENELQRQQVNKDLTDLEVTGKLNRRTVAKYKNILNENEYRQWFDRIQAREEKAKAASKEGATGEFKTDKGLDGKLFRRIVTDPDGITEAEIVDYIGNGLSRSSASTLLGELRRRSKGEIDPGRLAGEKAVIENLKRDRKAGLFGEGQAGEAEYAKQTEALKRWMKAHPDDDPSEYYEKLTEPNKTGFVSSVLDRVLGGFYDPKKADVSKRREELAGPGKKSVSIDSWLAAAKKANPKSSDSELRAFYKKKYGAK